MTSSQQPSQTPIARTVSSRPAQAPQAAGQKTVGTTLEATLLKHVGGGKTPVRGW